MKKYSTSLTGSTIRPTFKRTSAGTLRLANQGNANHHGKSFTTITTIFL
ncbi:hypothetical protein ACAW74_24630 [Fibrella sp. WM1]